jgi:hypothetical protein
MPVWGIVLAIIGGLLCCGLCAYGISKTVRRAKDRRDQRVHALTP